MPKRYCHNEIETKKLELSCDYIYFPDTTEVLCEDGVNIDNYYYSHKICLNRCDINEAIIKGDFTDKTCIIKTKNKVCEVR